MINMIAFIEHSQKDKLIVTETNSVVARSYRFGESVITKGYCEKLFWGNGTIVS